MISFNNLGNLGRLGNQMFQYASLKGIARKHGYSFCIPDKEYFGTKDPKVLDAGCDIYDVFNLQKENIIAITNNKKIKESTINFDKDLFETCPDNVDLDGYFQSEKYFEDIKDEIKKDFTFDKKLVNDVRHFLFNLHPQGEIISLHVRRSDYLNYPEHHPICNVEYYNNALKELPDNIPVIIFTDDEKWCEEQSLFDGDRFIISQENTVDFDLCLMTCCDYHIIANSSFSWWGAWLSKSKGVVAPINWFGPALSECKLEDRILETWVKI
ncbi:MAG: alpha-1,2-fucosyltransferase [Candidatus Fonsibacter ubiquis]